MKRQPTLFTIAPAAALILTGSASVSAHAAFLVQVDTDGFDDGPFTPSPNFAFGGDTTTASQSVASAAPLLPAGDSIFGGNGANLPDTYVFTYDPANDPDNLAGTGGVELGVDLLGNPVFGTGIAGGAPGDYRVYAAWPATTGVSGGLTNYDIDAGTDNLLVQADQNNANTPGPAGDVWVLLGTVTYDGNNPITVTQTPSSANTFVSMRAAAVLFEPVPEPGSLALLGLGGLALLRRRR